MIIKYNLKGDIQDVIDRVRDIDPDWCDPRVKALVITNLQQAQLWGTILWPEDKA